MISAASFPFQYIIIFDFSILCLLLYVWLGGNFQPITELFDKIAQSRNLAFPAQSADSHTRQEWKWLH